MTTIPEKPPARTGKCSLTLSIDGRRYRLRRDKPLHATPQPGDSQSPPVSAAPA